MNVIKKIIRRFRKYIYRAPKAKLLKLMPKNSICAEIGVWKGDFSKRILNTVKPKKLYLIDPWFFNTEYKNAMYGGSVEKSQKDMDEIYKSILINFRKEINQEKIEVFRNKFEDLLDKFPDNYFDWIYIDGDHTYNAVVKDLDNVTKKVKEGGLITGDDYTTGGWWKGGVKKAVDEYIVNHPEKEIKIMGSQFIIKK